MSELRIAKLEESFKLQQSTIHLMITATELIVKKLEAIEARLAGMPSPGSQN